MYAKIKTINYTFEKRTSYSKVKMYSKEGNVIISDYGENALDLFFNGQEILPGMFFEKDDLLELVIPDSICNLEEYAFMGCNNLSKIILPTTLKTIPDYAFYQCESLKEINFSENIIDIGYRIFDICESLQRINVDINNKKYKSIDGVLYDKDNFQLIKYPGGRSDKIFYVAQNTKSISKEAFDSTKINEIILPSSVETIEEFAFLNSELKKINLDNVKTIGKCAFAGCKMLTKLSIGSKLSNVFYETFYNTEKLEEIFVDDENTTMSSYKKLLCDKEQTEILYCPRSYRFDGLTFEETIKTIKEKAFSNCNNLERIDSNLGSDSLSLSSKINKIEAYAFCNCHNLKYVEIPKNIKVIKPYCFTYCDHLKDVIFENTMITLESFIFSNCSSLEHIKLPEKLLVINNHAFHACFNLKRIELPNILRTIGMEAFSDCCMLEEITLPDNIKNIGSYAFVNCTNLNKIIWKGIEYKRTEFNVLEDILKKQEIAKYNIF